MTRCLDSLSVAANGPSNVHRRRASYSLNSINSQQMNESLMKSNQQQQGNERTPLVNNSCGGAAESLVNTSVVGGAMQQGVSWRMAAFLLVNTALGAGMLNYPYAYNQIGGIWAAALMQVALLVLISATMFILVYCADFNRDDTYHDVLLSMCGKRAQQISAISILLTCYGINITFLVIIGDQYDRIFQSLLSADQLADFWFLERRFTIFVTAILFIWPMCYAQRLDFLRYASVLGMFAMLYVAFLTIYEHFVLDDATIEAITSYHDNTMQIGTNKTTTLQQSEWAHKWWFEPLAIVPVLCFAYQTHEVIVPVYACMRERRIGSFMKASLFGLVILFFLYNLVGAFGYLTFGERVGPDIMSLYDGKDPVVVVGIVALVVKFITTYPPLMFCGRSAIDGLYGELRQLSPNEFKQNEKLRHVLISTLWFFSTCALAVFAPDISITLQLLGLMASINVFVFPGMCLVSLTRRLRRARHALLMGEPAPECALLGAPPSCTSGAGSICVAQQCAKDYHLISGSYFGQAIMQRRQLLQQQPQHNTAPRNQLISDNNHLLHASGCNALVTHQITHPTNGLAGCPNQAHGKHFTATFASLIELENNLVKSTCSNDDQNLRREHNSLLLSSNQNGHASAPIASSCSSSSASGRMQQASRNGYGTGAPINGNSTLDERQEQFERLLTDGSCDACPCSVPTNNTKNNQSHGDSSDFDEQHLLLNTNQHNQPLPNSFSTGSKQFIVSNLTHANNNPALDLWASQEKKGAPTFTNSNQDQCSQSNVHNYAHQSVTNSLLNNLGSSIDPSTVAQVGISRCAAIGLYSFAGLLIAFGLFIFILEFISVIGVLES